MEKTSSNTFELRLSPDRLEVNLEIQAGAAVSAASVISALQAMKVVNLDNDRIVQLVENRNSQALSMVVCSGRAPLNERPARIQHLTPVCKDGGNQIAKVDGGQLVAVITPSAPGNDGVDVFGRPVAYAKSTRVRHIGRNLRDKNGQITATVRGNLRLTNDLLTVEPLLEINGFVKDQSMSIDFDGDVWSKGSICDGRTLNIGGLLIVGGTLEAVQLKAGGSVHVKGGIVGKRKGNYFIGGELSCRFINGSCITVFDNIRVQIDIVDSRIDCIGKLVLARGAICGGEVSANGGISCDFLGNKNGTQTLVEAGVGEAFQSHLAEVATKIDANRKRISEIRSKIEPLLLQIKCLTAQQREKATELLYNAKELESETEKMESLLDTVRQSLNDHALEEVRVHQAAYPGVLVKFPGVEAPIASAIQGPFVISTRRNGTTKEVVLTEETSHYSYVLPSRSVHSIRMSEMPKAAFDKAA